MHPNYLFLFIPWPSLSHKHFLKFSFPFLSSTSLKTVPLSSLPFPFLSFTVPFCLLHIFIYFPFSFLKRLSLPFPSSATLSLSFLTPLTPEQQTALATSWPAWATTGNKHEARYLCSDLRLVYTSQAFPELFPRGSEIARYYSVPAGTRYRHPAINNWVRMRLSWCSGAGVGQKCGVMWRSVELCVGEGGSGGGQRGARGENARGGEVGLRTSKHRHFLECKQFQALEMSTKELGQQNWILWSV